MLDLEKLQQFVTYAEQGTLSATAEVLHLSQPTLTRTMKHIEEEFGVTLFLREKNHIELTTTGRFAVEQARQVLLAAEKAVSAVQRYDQTLKTITVSSCAPAPLWTILPTLSHHFPNKTLSSNIMSVTAVINSVRQGKADVGILPYHEKAADLIACPYLKEALSICVPTDHTLASLATVTFSQLNGYNCLLQDHIGFWEAMVRTKMPASRFLVQTNRFEFNELVKNSTLLNFVTNLTAHKHLKQRVMIPISDEDATVHYHLIALKEKEALLNRVMAAPAEQLEDEGLLDEQRQ
ncbi:MAG: LysR family transcriptional regulator [Aerococcus sp.]|nr:LysR family transcriptional regulator [Aerococcus sp.]